VIGFLDEGDVESEMTGSPRLQTDEAAADHHRAVTGLTN